MHVAATLLLWLSSAILGVMDACLLYNQINIVLCGDSFQPFITVALQYEKACHIYDPGIPTGIIGTTIFTFVLCLVQFILFIRACVETHQHRFSINTPVILSLSPPRGSSSAPTHNHHMDESLQSIRHPLPVRTTSFRRQDTKHQPSTVHL